MRSAGSILLKSVLGFKRIANAFCKPEVHGPPDWRARDRVFECVRKSSPYCEDYKFGNLGCMCDALKSGGTSIKCPTPECVGSRCFGECGYHISGSGKAGNCSIAICVNVELARRSSQPGYHWEVKCRDQASDVNMPPMTHVLLHELAHCCGIGADIGFSPQQLCGSAVACCIYQETFGMGPHQFPCTRLRYPSRRPVPRRSPM